MSNGKPPCGQQDTTVDKDLTTILLIIGIIGTLVSVAKGSEAIAAWLVAQGVALGIPLAAVGGALIAFGIVLVMFYNRCSTPRGVDACSSGVINEIVPSFDSGVDQFFAFTAMHDRIDVVIKSGYWHLAQNNIFVRCSGHADQSPMIAGYFYSKEVCNAGTGAVIGGIAGVAGGILLGILAGAAIGCATVILCIFALIVAAIVAAVVVIAAAVAGGQIGRAAGGESEPSADGTALRVGDYVTTPGNLLNVEFLDGARAYWFVRTATLHGQSSGVPPFSHTDPDANLNPDACPVRGPD
jgi:hypothetical protein